MLSTLLWLTVICGLSAALIKVHREKSQLNQRYRKYESLPSKEEFERQLDSNIHFKQNEITEIEKQKEALNEQIITLQKKLRETEAKAYLKSINEYEFSYDFIDSKDYEIQLAKIKSDQEQMRKNKKAYICETQWRVKESKKEGEKMIKNYLKLIEIAFESQCKYAIKDVTFNNVKDLKKKINDFFEKINKLSSTTDCKISQDYLSLKLRELDLKYELEEKKQEEREREQAIRQQINQEKKERDVIEKARREAEKAEEQENLHQQQLEKIRQEIEEAEGEKRKQLEIQVKQLEELVAEDRSDKEKANLRITKLKRGYIYVISNIGSLGENIYRICMTKRDSNRYDYLSDMTPMVPFPFDVHLEIFSEDVSDTIQRLRKRFQHKRVNIVNDNRDFYRVSLDEIVEAVEEIKNPSKLRIFKDDRYPHAYEYRRTLAKQKKHLLSSDYLKNDEIEGG